MLAAYGRDSNGDAYIHVRVYKAKRVFAEIYTTYPISLMCRWCGRWWRINIVNKNITAQERNVPEVLIEKNSNPIVLLDNDND